MIYLHCDVPPSPAEGAAQAELFLYQQPTAGSLIVEFPILSDGVDTMLRPGSRRFTVKMAPSPVLEPAWQPRTERGRRLMALRERVVASGTRLLDLDEINQGLAGGRRQSV